MQDTMHKYSDSFDTEAKINMLKLERQIKCTDVKGKPCHSLICRCEEIDKELKDLRESLEK